MGVWVQWQSHIALIGSMIIWKQQSCLSRNKCRSRSPRTSRAAAASSAFDFPATIGQAGSVRGCQPLAARFGTAAEVSGAVTRGKMFCFWSGVFSKYQDHLKTSSEPPWAVRNVTAWGTCLFTSRQRGDTVARDGRGTGRGVFVCMCMCCQREIYVSKCWSQIAP